MSHDMSLAVPSTPSEFRAWRRRMATRRGGSYSQADVARDLDTSVLTIKRYEKLPQELGDDPPFPVPRAVGLACAALEAGLERR